MATYKEIHGVKVQYRDSDATAVEGDVWYNSSTGLLKMYSAVGAWATGGTLNTIKGAGTGGGTAVVGTQTSAINAYGQTTPPSALTANAETYDGSSWTEVANTNTVRAGLGAAGASSASGIFFGGYDPAGTNRSPLVESWDNSSWTEVGDLNTGRNGTSGCGIQAAALCAGGFVADVVANVETWNGTSWTEVGDLNTARHNLASFGLSTAAIATGGAGPGATTESWDNSSWTEVGDLNTARVNIDGGGIQTAGLVFGGNPPGTPSLLGVTESWDGSAWTEVADLATSRYDHGGTGTSTLGLCVGGTAPAITGATEEWAFAASIQTVTFD